MRMLDFEIAQRVLQIAQIDKSRPTISLSASSVAHSVCGEWWWWQRKRSLWQWSKVLCIKL